MKDRLIKLRILLLFLALLTPATSLLAMYDGFPQGYLNKVPSAPPPDHMEMADIGEEDHSSEIAIKMGLLDRQIEVLELNMGKIQDGGPDIAKNLRPTTINAMRYSAKLMKEIYQLRGLGQITNEQVLNDQYAPGSIRSERIKTKDGRCNHREIDCLDNYFWAGEVACCMSCDCDSDATCLAYGASLGLYAIPVGLTSLALMIAQGASFIATLPCRCICACPEYKDEVSKNPQFEIHLEQFLGDIKVLRKALDEI